MNFTSPYPEITGDTEKLRHNAEILTELAANRGVEIAGVVKCCCGAPEVAHAFTAGGCLQIADSRIQNLRRLRQCGINCPLWLLRIPMPSEAEETVRYADLSLNSSGEVLELLSQAAVKAGKIHQVLLMTDLGDRREGVQPGELENLFRYAESLPGIYPAGIGTNLTCYGGIIPDEENMGLLVELARKLERDLKRKLRYVSAGNSSALKMLLEGRLPAGLNHLRCGESLLLGRETCNGGKIPNMFYDAFTLTAEVIESTVKPSFPAGTMQLNAFGEKPQIPDLGIRNHLLLGIGRADVNCDGITPRREGIRILGASSDHLIADVEDCSLHFNVGDTLDFDLEYSSLLSGMISPYVSKRWLSPEETPDFKGWKILRTPFSSDEAFSSFCRLPADPLFSAFAHPCGTCDSLSSVAPEVKNCLEQQIRPLLWGGSHRVALELARGLPSGAHRCGWIMFSAYSDFNTGESGAITPEGMTLSAICGKTVISETLEHPIPERNVVLIGVRSIEPQERSRLQHSDIQVFTMEEIDRYCISEIMERALKYLNGVNSLVVDFSMSVLDPEYTTSQDVPPCGLTLREGFCALEILSDSGKLTGAALTEIPDNETAQKNAAALTRSLLGNKILR
ncbi:MAG: hypothetical protein E7054_06200 [Lentisphaerae bacterium]|nr:hypothetical protein [Lentisphaerota bacterium]